MSDRLKRTVLLGDLLNPDTLFTKLPPLLAARCRRAFIQGRNETLEAQARLGIAPPGSPSLELTPFTGRAYDDDGQPTPAYLDHWRAYYNQGPIQEAQAKARVLLNRDDNEND